MKEIFARLTVVFFVVVILKIVFSELSPGHAWALPIFPCICSQFFFNVLVSKGGLTMRMSEEKDMLLSSPVRTLKSQLAAEQPSAGESWILLKKDTSCPRAKEKPQQDSRRGEIAFRIKLHTYQRHSENASKTLCTSGPRERSSDPQRRLSQTCL